MDTFTLASITICTGVSLLFRIGQGHNNERSPEFTNNIIVPNTLLDIYTDNL